MQNPVLLIKAFIMEFHNDSRVALQAYVAVGWSCPTLAFPIVSRYRLARAGALQPAVVLSAYQGCSATVGQEVKIDVACLNCSKVPRDLTLVMSRPSLIESHEHGLTAGLECADVRIHVGECFPMVPQWVSVAFHAYRAGIYRLSCMVLSADGAPLPHAFLASQVCVQP